MRRKIEISILWLRLLSRLSQNSLKTTWKIQKCTQSKKRKKLGRKGEIQMRGFSRFGSLTKVKKGPIKTLFDGQKYATADASKERGDHTLYGSWCRHTSFWCKWFQPWLNVVGHQVVWPAWSEFGSSPRSHWRRTRWWWRRREPLLLSTIHQWWMRIEQPLLKIRILIEVRLLTSDWTDVRT